MSKRTYFISNFQSHLLMHLEERAREGKVKAISPHLSGLVFVNSLRFIHDRSAQLVRRPRRLEAKMISLRTMSCNISCLLVGVGTCANF
jgi:hypothetical protein